MDENLKEDPRDDEQDSAQDDSSTDTTDTTDSPEGDAERSRPPRPGAAEWERLMDEAERRQPDEVETVQETNRKRLGQITLHYPARDVKVLLDGDSAIRLLTMFRERDEGHWSDYLNPFISSAERGWLVMDLTEPLAISYLPLGDQAKRTSIDPAVYAAANPSVTL